MKPPPTPAADWSDELRALHAHDMREMWDRGIAPHIWNQYHSQLELYQSFAREAPLDILDVGCAQGTLALLLAERGHRVTAVDLRPAFLDYARSRYTHGDLRLLTADVLRDEIPGDYDLVFANQIVEHLAHPDQLVQRLLHRLKPGGRLVMTTPNHDYVKNALPGFRELGDPRDWEHRQNTADADGHFYAYRADELAGVFRACGLEQVQARFFESPAINGHMKVRHVHGFMPAALLQAADRLLLALPGIGRKLAHQLLVTGTKARA
jgi:SAM-dependent methyltransferase